MRKTQITSVLVEGASHFPLSNCEREVSSFGWFFFHFFVALAGGGNHSRGKRTWQKRDQIDREKETKEKNSNEKRELKEKIRVERVGQGEIGEKRWGVAARVMCSQ